MKQLLRVCEDLKMEVIPLVQTFGHMEFVLKHDEFSYLRDVNNSPDSICPCHTDTMAIISEIIDQVMEFHNKAKYLHIGCDEVFHLGECSECNEKGGSKLYVNHVMNVAGYVKKKYNIKAIIWDDMLRNLFLGELHLLSQFVEPMVWVYTEDVRSFVPLHVWSRYSLAFPFIWTASAFKGAHGESLVVPDVLRHLHNNLNWLTVIAQERKKLQGGFRGVVLTGWQRYDHFAVLCELLPASIPSLFINLLATSHGFFNQTLVRPLLNELKCSHYVLLHEASLNLEKDRFLWEKLNWCAFHGARYFKLTKMFINIEKNVLEFLNKIEKRSGWLTSYNVRHNFSSPARMQEVRVRKLKSGITIYFLLNNLKSWLQDLFLRRQSYGFMMLLNISL